MIEFKNVSKKYKNGTNALQNVNLKVEAGEFVYISKSVYIKMIYRDFAIVFVYNGKCRT